MPDWMLSFDASAPRTCVALGRVTELADELVVEDEDEDGANQTSARLHERLAAALAEAGIRARDLTCVGCGRGPGTFTGTRVAVALAKGLGIGLGRPIVGVSTLAALACSAGVQGRVLALLDARREQVYGGLFDCSKGVVARSDERALALRELVATLGDDLVGAIAFGPGCGPYAEQLPIGIPATHAGGPSARGLWRASVSAWRAGTIADAATLEVSYLRQSYAEMGVHVPKRAVFKTPWA
ncbi:tRNA (adenosine(37)-N6)-threonylcarbamoyltransferase complex dimerization subunit type 1 TsaB [Nannocystaceae bacterium ST9]